MVQIKLILALSVALLLAPQRMAVYITGGTAPSSGLIQLSDLTCSGVFLSPYLPSGDYTTHYPITYRYEAGARHYFVYAGDGHVYEFGEPTPSSCNTALNSVTQATVEGWGGDWGTFPVNAAGGFQPNSPNNNAVYAFGLFYDTGTSQLFLTWLTTYTNIYQHNTIGGATLNSGPHTLSVTGCWGLDSPYNMTQVGSGMLHIPSGFVASYLPAGRNLAVGMGGFLGLSQANSYGPVLVAFNPPSGNACASNTDTFIGSYTELQRYASGTALGPNCAPASNEKPADTMGCTPVDTPHTPYSAEQAFTGYSTALYTTNWDPYASHGWFTYGTVGKLGWYDDGVKHGIVSPYITQSGWLNQTVLASPAPTFTNPTGTFSITSTSMHDGYNANPGDLMWVQTCTAAADGAGCATNQVGNNRDLSFVHVDTVNNGTGAITYTLISTDGGNGATGHVPVIGGNVYEGAIYAAGEPSTSRGTARIQIYDPAQYAEVIATTRQPYSVRYIQEGSAVSLFGTQLGDPSLGAGVASIGANGSFVQKNISATMTDESAHQIIVSISDVKLSGNYASAIYILNVSQSQPDPVLVGVNLAMLLMGAICLPSVLPLRRRFA